MNARSAIAAAAWFSLLFSCAPVAAEDYSSLLRARRFAEVETLADARLAQDPGDAGALAAKSEAMVANGSPAQIDEAVKLAERCVASHPQLSICHLASGNALGAKAARAGLVAAMRYATRVRDDFAKAVELDPRNTDARFALLDYYMQAPAVVGGGKAKARALATQTQTINPAAARLMQAQLELEDKELAKAEATLISADPGNAQMAADRQRDLLTALAHRYAAENRHVDSERVRHILQQRFPGN